MTALELTPSETSQQWLIVYVDPDRFHLNTKNYYLWKGKHPSQCIHANKRRLKSWSWVGCEIGLVKSTYPLSLSVMAKRNLVYPNGTGLSVPPPSQKPNPDFLQVWHAILSYTTPLILDSWTSGGLCVEGNVWYWYWGSMAPHAAFCAIALSSCTKFL